MAIEEGQDWIGLEMNNETGAPRCWRQVFNGEAYVIFIYYRRSEG